MADEGRAPINVVLIGFGSVGKAFSRLIRDSSASLASKYGIRLNIAAVSDLRFGSLVPCEGMDVSRLAETSLQPGGFEKYPGGSSRAQNETIIRDVPADIVIEATFTNPVDGEPATSHCRRAIEAGRHVVTCNKGPVAFAGKELKALAARKGVTFAYEGAVMSGTPVIRVASQTLAMAGIHGFEGILNGTSNFVLGRMGEGLDLGAAVREAQALGYAEADPSADIEGHDVRLKVAIMANELLGADISPEQVLCEGISGLQPADILKASRAGQHWKLIGSASRDERGSVTAAVAPRALSSGHPLANIAGATNAITFRTDVLGDVSMVGPGAGPLQTAYALLSDIIAIYRS
ncbi:homoserine dehydrogenase [Bradyrhizobium sp. B097]|uniref:homoserine dehydrogenase n=1 Tax=Bradyrhizobium sp. B097 TaxID=3140244 RepID=UPI0031836BF6